MHKLNSNSLYSWIRKQTKPLENHVIVKLLSEIALGMYYLHSRKPMIIHRDLKSPNVLVIIKFFLLFLNSFQLDSNLVAKISDFGLSKIKESTIMSNTAINTVGSVPWAAPEYLTVKRKNERNEKGDVFSFGVIVWELVTLQVPWKSGNHTIEDIKESVIEGVRLEIPKCSERLQNVMKRCWDHGKQCFVLELKV